MRTLRIKLYKFDELSKKAQAVAIDARRNDRNKEYSWQQENRESLNAFENIFQDIVTVRDAYYDGYHGDVTFNINYDDTASVFSHMTGQRLATYLWNNYGDKLYTGKVYSKLVNTFKDGTPIPVSPQHPAGLRLPKRRSNVFLELATPTGYTMDYSLFNPIDEFLSKPDPNINIGDLIQSCFNSWVNDCNADIQGQDSDEAIIEHLSANDFEFTKEGEMY